MATLSLRDGAVFWRQKCTSDRTPGSDTASGNAVVAVYCFRGTFKGVGWRRFCEHSPQVELVLLFGSTVALAELVEVLSVEHLAAVTGVKNLLCDARSGSQYLVVCIWEGYHHLARLLYDFCMGDAVG